MKQSGRFQIWKPWYPTKEFWVIEMGTSKYVPFIFDHVPNMITYTDRTLYFAELGNSGNWYVKTIDVRSLEEAIRLYKVGLLNDKK